MNTKQRRNRDMRPEYDFSSMKGGIRLKYYERYRKGSKVVLLDPDIAKAFPTEDAVNEACGAFWVRRSLSGGLAVSLMVPCRLRLADLSAVFADQLARC